MFIHLHSFKWGAIVMNHWRIGAEEAYFESTEHVIQEQYNGLFLNVYFICR